MRNRKQLVMATATCIAVIVGMAGQSASAQGDWRATLADWAVNIAIDIVGPKAKEMIESQIGGVKRNDANLSGLYFHNEDGAYAFVVETDKNVQFFYDTSCCLHVFLGARQKEDAKKISGKMFRRQKNDNCVTEYDVDLRRALGSTTKLDVRFRVTQPSCGITTEFRPERVFERRS